MCIHFRATSGTNKVNWFTWDFRLKLYKSRLKWKILLLRLHCLRNRSLFFQRAVSPIIPCGRRTPFDITRVLLSFCSPRQLGSRKCPVLQRRMMFIGVQRNNYRQSCSIGREKGRSHYYNDGVNFSLVRARTRTRVMHRDVESLLHKITSSQKK